jgi:hypothetical protein
MALDRSLRRNFWLVPVPLLAIAALLNAQAVTELVGVAIAVDATRGRRRRRRGVVVRVLSAPDTTTARVENGRTVGVRMMGIRSDTLLGVLGMQDGDRLQTINGFEIANPEKALEAYARLRTADKLTMQLNRGGKNLNLDYNIR